MIMTKRSERLTLLASLIAAGGLCFAPSAARAQAASITVGNVSGNAGQQVTVSVTVSNGDSCPSGDCILGTQNDIGYDPSTPIPISAQANCSITTTQSCVTDADCPPLQPPLSGNEPCVNSNAPDCQVNPDIMKGGFFAFEPSACTGDGCTGIRALIFALDNTMVAIPDGSVLYTCKVDVAQGTADGNYPLTVPDGSVSIANTDFQMIPGATGFPGAVTVPGTGGQSYIECDVDPQSGDNAGEFGDNSIDIFDVRALFNAAQLDIDTPADGSARFSAMDASPTDNPPACGGDGALDVFDVRQCFNVAQGLTDTNYMRTGTGDSCVSEALQ
jgi:hypothetical protein